MLLTSDSAVGLLICTNANFIEDSRDSVLFEKYPVYKFIKNRKASLFNTDFLSLPTPVLSVT